MGRMLPTLQELQRSFEYKYDCKFISHSNPELGEICVSNSGRSDYNFNIQWYYYVRETAGRYSDEYVTAIIPSDTKCTRITAWNKMYSDFYDRYICTMQLRKLEIQALVETKVREQVKIAVDQALRTVDYATYIKKLDKVSRIVKENPLYTRTEVEAILAYLDPTCNRYKKNTLDAMRALNRFSRENRIDFNSSVRVWKEYL